MYKNQYIYENPLKFIPDYEERDRNRILPNNSELDRHRFLFNRPHNQEIKHHRSLFDIPFRNPESINNNLLDRPKKNFLENKLGYKDEAVQYQEWLESQRKKTPTTAELVSTPDSYAEAIKILQQLTVDTHRIKSELHKAFQEFYSELEDLKPKPTAKTSTPTHATIEYQRVQPHKSAELAIETTPSPETTPYQLPGMKTPLKEWEILAIVNGGLGFTLGGGLALLGTLANDSTGSVELGIGTLALGTVAAVSPYVKRLTPEIINAAKDFVHRQAAKTHEASDFSLSLPALTTASPRLQGIMDQIANPIDTDWQSDGSTKIQTPGFTSQTLVALRTPALRAGLKFANFLPHSQTLEAHLEERTTKGRFDKTQLSVPSTETTPTVQITTYTPDAFLQSRLELNWTPPEKLEEISRPPAAVILETTNPNNSKSLQRILLSTAYKRHLAWKGVSVSGFPDTDLIDKQTAATSPHLTSTRHSPDDSQSLNSSSR